MASVSQVDGVPARPSSRASYSARCATSLWTSSGSAGKEVRPAQVTQKERREPGQIARHGARQEIDLKIGDRVEVRRTALVGADVRELGALRGHRRHARPVDAGEALLDVPQGRVVLVHLGPLGSRRARRETREVAPDDVEDALSQAAALGQLLSLRPGRRPPEELREGLRRVDPFGQRSPTGAVADTCADLPAAHSRRRARATCAASPRRVRAPPRETDRPTRSVRRRRCRSG